MLILPNYLLNSHPQFPGSIIYNNIAKCDVIVNAVFNVISLHVYLVPTA